MTNLLPQRILELAVAGGYKMKEGFKAVYQVGTYSIFIEPTLDPIFWQCLGKRLGWTDRIPVYKGVRLVDNEWKYQHHRFIEALHENKVDEFWEELLTKE